MSKKPGLLSKLFGCSTKCDVKIEEVSDTISTPDTKDETASTCCPESEAAADR